ncbi:MAG: hypothetical protein RR661_06585, partial [Anaerovoracaceae bacterium]
ILHCFKQDDGRFSVFGDQSTAIALNVSFIKAVAGPALSVTVLFAEPQRHVLPVDVMTAICLFKGKDTPAGDASKGAVSITVTQADEHAENIVQFFDQL